MNPLMQMLGQVAGGGQGKNAIFMQALGAMSRGESPESFLASLAKNDSRFQGIDFSNLEKAAHNLCQQKGVDENKALEQVKGDLQSIS